MNSSNQFNHKKKKKKQEKPPVSLQDVSKKVQYRSRTAWVARQVQPRPGGTVRTRGHRGGAENKDITRTTGEEQEKQDPKRKKEKELRLASPGLRARQLGCCLALSPRGGAGGSLETLDSLSQPDQGSEQLHSTEGSAVGGSMTDLEL